jgi:regulator of nonsense transcripts 3
MSTAEPTKASSSKFKAKESKDPKELKESRDKESRKQRISQKAHTERLKTVVRRLPPNLPEEVFWQSVQKWVSDETVTWKEYYGGKFRKR